MQDDHPSLETLARWLAGELEHEQVRRELAPHFLEACPKCRTLRDEIARLLEESGHWDESVAMWSPERASVVGPARRGSTRNGCAGPGRSRSFTPGECANSS